MKVIQWKLFFFLNTVKNMIFFALFYSTFQENFDVQIPKGGNLMLKGGAVLAVIAFIVTIVTTMCSRNATKRAKED